MIVILGEAVCPKCNADALLKVEEHKKDVPFIVFLYCSKCKARLYQGTMSRRELVLAKVAIKLKQIGEERN